VEPAATLEDQRIDLPERAENRVDSASFEALDHLVFDRQRLTQSQALGGQGQGTAAA
jgi:hypothetical protein